MNNELKEVHHGVFQDNKLSWKIILTRNAGKLLSSMTLQVMLVGCRQFLEPFIEEGFIGFTKQTLALKHSYSCNMPVNN